MTHEPDHVCDALCCHGSGLCTCITCGAEWDCNGCYSCMPDDDDDDGDVRE